MPDEYNPLILFEHPLNERCRTLLRLSRLFTQFEKQLAKENPWSSKTALQALLEISSVLTRTDIKSEFIKELERQGKNLSKMSNNPDVDTVRLEQILGEIHTLSSMLKKDTQQLGISLRKNEFLNNLAQRLSIPGGSFDFDLPQLHYWLHLPHAERAMQLDGWREDIIHVQATVDLLLTLIRNSTHSQECVAESGVFQQNLDSKRAIQMVQVAVQQDLDVFPEISGGKHRYYIRFMQTTDWAHPEVSQNDIPFKVRTCII